MRLGGYGVKVIHHLSLLRLDEIGCERGSEMAGREHVLRRVGRVVRSSGGSEVLQAMRRFWDRMGTQKFGWCHLIQHVLRGRGMIHIRLEHHPTQWEEDRMGWNREKGDTPLLLKPFFAATQLCV